jgi:hypothetical protein
LLVDGKGKEVCDKARGAKPTEFLFQWAILWLVANNFQ